MAIPARRRKLAKRVLGDLEQHGLLLVQDAVLPSVCTLVAGAPVRGSWWGHAEGSLIWHLLGDLDEHPDILWAKLVAGKVTLVHRRLWPAFLAVATGREAWQLEGLGPGERALLARVDGEPLVSVAEAAVPTGEKASACARRLEGRLLCDSYQEHSEGGKHVKFLRSWEQWRRVHHHRGRLPSAAAGRTVLEEAGTRLEAACRGRVRFPW